MGLGLATVVIEGYLKRTLPSWRRRARIDGGATGGVGGGCRCRQRRRVGAPVR